MKKSKKFESKQEMIDTHVNFPKHQWLWVTEAGDNIGLTPIQFLRMFIDRYQLHYEAEQRSKPFYGIKAAYEEEDASQQGQSLSDIGTEHMTTGGSLPRNSSLDYSPLRPKIPS